MFSDLFITELGIALQAQNHLLEKIELAVSEIDQSLKESTRKLSTVKDTANQIKELQAIMDELEADVEWFEEEDFEDFKPEQILSLYENRQKSVFRELTKLKFKNWESFVKQCQSYALYEGIDPLAPYDIFLTETDIQILQAESYDAQYQWDKWDYCFVGVSGVLASLTDYLLVRIPQTLTTGEYSGQIGSPITEWIKQYNPENSNDWFARWVKNLSETCKVPYDSMNYTSQEGFERIAGMYPKSHRFQSFGHDPVLGFVFGVLDIMRGTITGFSCEKLTHTHIWIQETVWSDREPIDLITAIIRHIGHLISDVATPMGLPAPFMTLIQQINIGSFEEQDRTIGEITRWMYLNGYDFRHFLVSGITPAVIEIILRAYIMLRHYSEHGKVKIDIASNPKYRTMLLFAHSIATLGNVGKIALMQGNPLAINYAQWFALIRYTIPSIKYWIFDHHRLQIDHLEKINSTEWDQLLQNSDRLFKTVVEEETSHIGILKIS